MQTILQGKNKNRYCPNCPHTESKVVKIYLYEDVCTKVSNDANVEILKQKDQSSAVLYRINCLIYDIEAVDDNEKVRRPPGHENSCR